MKLMKIFIVIFLALSTPAMAAGPLGDIERSIGKIADNVKIDKAVRDQARTVEKAVKDIGYTIERAALIRKVTENALADRMRILEARIVKQEAIISNYESLVLLLRAELKELSGE